MHTMYLMTMLKLDTLDQNFCWQCLVDFLFELMTFDSNAFSVAAMIFYEPYDAWIKPNLSLLFKKAAKVVAEYCWSVDAAGCTIDPAKLGDLQKNIILQS